MDNAFLLYELARMRQREIEDKIALRQMLTHAKIQRTGVTRQLKSLGGKVLKVLKVVRNRINVPPAMNNFQRVNQG